MLRRKPLLQKILKHFCLNTKKMVCEYNSQITPHCLMVLKQENKRRQGLELFAFSVSGFQREKVSSDQSHMHCRYMGRSGVKGRGFNNITFLRFAILLEQRAQSAEMASDMWSSPGKHRCPYEFIDPNS